MSDDEKPPEAPPAPEPLKWERRTEMRICKEMQEIVKATISVSQKQIDLLKRKIEKLQYGS